MEQLTASEEILPPETEKALKALEDARQELATEEGLIVVDPAAPEESFVIDHGRVLQCIDKALEPFEGQYDATTNPSCER